MADTYPIQLQLENCTDNNSSATYTNDASTYAVFAAKAQDGFQFKEHDGGNFYISRSFDGTTKVSNFDVKKVDKSQDEYVIKGEANGITTDGKYICRRVTVGSQNTGVMTCFIKASIEEAPPTPTITVTNNVEHTTYKTEVQGDNTVITLTCENGFTFDGVPTVTYGADPEDPFADATTENMTVSGDVATFSLATDSYGGYATLGGKTKTKTVEPTEPTVTNNIADATESHTVDGSSVTVNLTSKKVMLNVSCAYKGTDGRAKTVNVPVNVVIHEVVDTDTVTSNASVTLPDVDFNTPIVITGDTKQAMRIDYNLSGCTPVEKPTYCFVGEMLTITLTADSGNEFADASKCKITGYNPIGSYETPMTVSEDKLTATGSITPTVGSIDRDDFYIIVDAIATPTSTPTKK